jgi:hypothetical protein
MKNLKCFFPFLLVLYYCNNTLSECNFDESGLLPLAENEIDNAKNYIDSLDVLLPTDESSFSADFSNFKNSVITAIINRDTSFILSILDSSILNSFGGIGGINEFKTMWKIENDNSQFWSLFKESLELGGTFSDDTLTFAFPYLSTSFPKKYDSFFYGALIKENANIYLSPNKDSKFHSASYKIFRILQWSDLKYSQHQDFIHILVSKNRYGFVTKSDFRSPLDYRGRFIYKYNSWKLKSFVAGD